MGELDRLSRRLQSLRLAQTGHLYVRVERSIGGADQVIGYVVAVGTQWALLSVLTDGAPDGWVALHIADIVSVETSPGGRFVRRGLEFRGQWPAAPPKARLPMSTHARELITAAVRRFDVVTLYLEHQDPGTCVVGRPLRWVGNRVHWQELTPAADWAEVPTIWELPLITRVDIGGDYEQALSRVAELHGKW